MPRKALSKSCGSQAGPAWTLELLTVNLGKGSSLLGAYGVDLESPSRPLRLLGKEWKPKEATGVGMVGVSERILGISSG